MVVPIAPRARPRRSRWRCARSGRAPTRPSGPREMVLGLVHSRFLRVLANPIVAAALFFFSLVVFYYSPLFELALRTHTGHVLMIVHFLLTGYLFAWVLIGVDPGPPKWSPSLRLAHPLRDDLLPRLLRGRHDQRHDAAGPELLRGAAAAVAPRPARRPARRGSDRLGHRRAADPDARAAGRRGLGPHRRAPRPGAWTARPTATTTPSSTAYNARLAAAAARDRKTTSSRGE